MCVGLLFVCKGYDVGRLRWRFKQEGRLHLSKTVLLGENLLPSLKVEGPSSTVSLCGRKRRVYDRNPGLKEWTFELSETGGRRTVPQHHPLLHPKLLSLAPRLGSRRRRFVGTCRLSFHT